VLPFAAFGVGGWVASLVALSVLWTGNMERK
jgi:hypothetical protein